eukprot:scaffold23321_cov107-Amphora_coffeaeformis.AAC.2
MKALVRSVLPGAQFSTDFGDSCIQVRHLGTDWHHGQLTECVGNRVVGSGKVLKGWTEFLKK